MEKNTDNDNKNDTKVSTSNTTEVVETVEKPKKQKRKFEWTPKRKAAFEKCVAARKSQIEPKAKLKSIKEEKEEDDDSSVSTANSSLSLSSEKYRKPRRKGLKKQFYRLKKDLIYNMKKQLKKKTYLTTTILIILIIFRLITLILLLLLAIFNSHSNTKKNKKKKKKKHQANLNTVLSDEMTDSKEQREFTKDLIDAGYKKFKSEEENQILRKHNLSRDESLSNDKNRVYKDNTSGKAYVLYPGTKDKKDIATDIAIGLGGLFTPIQNLTPRYREAKRVASKVKQKYGSDKVTAIGHSLGGGLAASSGIQKRITYNKAVGLSDLWRPVSSGQIDYRTKKDPVSFLSYFQRYKKGAKKYN